MHAFGINSRDDPVTTDPKGESFGQRSKLRRRILLPPHQAMPRTVRCAHHVATVDTQEKDIVYAMRKHGAHTMSAHRILGLEKVPRVWLFAS